MSDLTPPNDSSDELRAAWHRYIDVLVPLRRALYAYCRRLTGNLWDAEKPSSGHAASCLWQWGSLIRPFATTGTISSDAPPTSGSIVFTVIRLRRW